MSKKLCISMSCERLNKCPYSLDLIKYCPGYETEKPESAWFLAREILLPLNKDKQDELYLRIFDRMPDILHHDEQEAINMIKKIKNN